MKKIISLFKRDYQGNRLVYDEVVPGAEWVLRGEGIATEKFDGTACLIRNGILYKRYDRKLTKSAQRIKRRHRGWVPSKDQFKSAPEGWMPVEKEPDLHTAHWPGWLLVDFDKPENKWHKEAWHIVEDEYLNGMGYFKMPSLDNCTCELIGPKIQGNPYEWPLHKLWKHGSVVLWNKPIVMPLTFNIIKEYLRTNVIEGIVWHHPDGRMVKIKRKDFGFDWPGK